MTSGLRPFNEIPGLAYRSVIGAFRRQYKLFRDPIGTMQTLQQRFGNLVRSELPTDPMLFCFGPEYNQRIYGDGDLFRSVPLTIPARKDTAQFRLRRSIFRLNGREHQRMRHQILPPFQRTSVAANQPAIEKLIHEATESWQPGDKRNLHHDMHLLVWSIVRQVLYGLEANAATQELHTRLEGWMFRRFSPWVTLFPVSLPFTPFRRMLKDAVRLEEQFLSIMLARRSEASTASDALSSLLQFKNEDGTPVPDEELVGHAATLFLVAYETTANTLTWTLFLLAQHPHILQLLLDELAPFNGNVPSFDKLEQLPLLNRVMKESMRLLPAVPYNRRVTSREDAIDTYCLPRRTRVLFSIYTTHHMPELYPEPNRFAPERWETIKPTMAEYLPFGMGKRTCLGSTLAQYVVRVALAAILPKWKITIEPNARIDRLQGISLGMRQGMPVILDRQDRQLRASPVCGNIHEMIDLREDESVRMPQTAILRRAA